MKAIQAKVTRAEKRGRKIILTIESDLYSDEPFAVTPFYDEGEKKNQLQSVHFDLKITESGGKVSAKLEFGNCLNHFTKGHSQLHQPLTSFFISKKECAMNWFLNEKQEWFTDEKIHQVLKLWESDEEFHKELLQITERRKKEFKISALNKAKEDYHKALDKLNEALSEI